jgi:hypothetical protein
VSKGQVTEFDPVKPLWEVIVKRLHIYGWAVSNFNRGKSGVTPVTTSTRYKDVRCLQ